MTSDSITLSIRGDAPTSQKDLVYTSWYFNGLQSYAYQSIGSLLKLPTGITQSMTIRNPTPLHAGTYETLLQLNPVSYLHQLGCPDEYSNFITQSSRAAGVNSIIVDQVAVDLKYYGEFNIHVIMNVCAFSFVLMFSYKVSLDPQLSILDHKLFSSVQHKPYNDVPIECIGRINA